MDASGFLHVGKPNVGDRALFHHMVDEIFDRGWLTNDGPLVQRLEARICEMSQARHCVLVANGTVGLQLVARALGLTGEVIVPSFTFVSTVSALQWLGLAPVFADIDEQTHNIDPAAVRELVTPRTSAIVAVHLWGRPAAVDSLQRIADEHDLALIFDAAHAFGCSIGGRPIGTFGDAEVFSFHATKFFNTFEGGAVVTDNDELAADLRLGRNFGFTGLDRVEAVGINAKMPEISAAMGLVNLQSVDQFITVNRRNHELYSAELGAIAGLHVIGFAPHEANNFQYIVVEVSESCPADRDTILEHLRAHGVLARRYFWPGVHRTHAFADTAGTPRVMLPHTDAVAERVLVLPNGDSVGLADVHRVCRLVREVVEAAGVR